MNTLIPGAPLRSLSPTSIEYQRAQGASRAAKPVRAARFTLDAPEHSGTIPGAIGGHPAAGRCVNVQPRCHLHAEPIQMGYRHLPKLREALKRELKIETAKKNTSRKNVA